MIKKLLGVIFLIMVSNVQAASWNNWEVFQVMTIIIEGAEDGSWYNIRVKPTPTSTGCADPGYMVLDASTTKGQSILSTLIAADATGRKFHILTDGCDGVRPRLKGIWTLN